MPGQIAPLSGGPLLPPSVLSGYAVGFVALVALTYLYLRRRVSPKFVHEHLRLIFWSGVAVKSGVLLVLVMTALCWLVPRPRVVETWPMQGASVGVNQEKIEIVFDRPVARRMVGKRIVPEVPGVFVFESPVYGSHLYNKLVFYPTFSLDRGTNYKVKLEGVAGLMSVQPGRDLELGFETVEVPTVKNVKVPEGPMGAEVEGIIEVELSGVNRGEAEFDFELTPRVSYDARLNEDGDVYLVEPHHKLAQGTHYEVAVRRTDLVWDLQQGEVVARGRTSLVYNEEFVTREAPGIEELVPEGVNVLVNGEVEVEFTEAMDRNSVEENFSVSPEVSGWFEWQGDKRLVYHPDKFSYDTDYRVMIARGTKSAQGGFLEEEVVGEFETIGAVEVARVFPAQGWRGVDVKSGIELGFDQEVDERSVLGKVRLEPAVEGNWEWQGEALVFEPSGQLEFGKDYQVIVEAGVKSVQGLDLEGEYSSSFRTQDELVRLAVGTHLQEKPLSCEVAALKMALSYRGHGVSEDELLDRVGVDATPQQGGVWGDPYQAFVGNVYGKQMKDGYGVYWEPIGRVAREFTGAEVFEGWSTEQLMKQLAQDNPVLIWVYSRGGRPTSWMTPAGREVFAVSGEHVVTAVGFLGPVSDPTHVIVNDPLVGQVYWPRDVFEKKWRTFNGSGVVIL